jgi:hypothetical protein
MAAIIGGVSIIAALFVRDPPAGWRYSIYYRHVHEELATSERQMSFVFDGRPIRELFRALPRTGFVMILLPLATRLPLLLWQRVVEFSVVEQQTTLRRNAGDVPITMLPTDIARRIQVTCIELLGGAVIDAADIEHQKRIALNEIRRRQSMERTVLINEVKQVPAQCEYRMVAAIELQLIKTSELLSFPCALDASDPQLSVGP